MGVFGTQPEFPIEVHQRQKVAAEAIYRCSVDVFDILRSRFEADEFDAETRSGWSVVITGRASVVTDPAENERLTSEAARGAGENTAETKRSPQVGGGGAVASTSSGSTWSPMIQP